MMWFPDRSFFLFDNGHMLEIVSVLGIFRAYANKAALRESRLSPPSVRNGGGVRLAVCGCPFDSFKNPFPMKQLHFQEKYPITVVDIAKSETRFQSVDAIAGHITSCIADTPRTTFIGIFDHYGHTRSIAGDIAPGILAAVNVLFCFGHAIPVPEVLALRPRSFGIADLGDRFVITFMEAPMKPANDAMQAWALSLRNA